MKVYLFEGGNPFEGSEVLGVYRTEEGAKQAAMYYAGLPMLDWDGDSDFSICRKTGNGHYELFYVRAEEVQD